MPKPNTAIDVRLQSIREELTASEKMLDDIHAPAALRDAIVAVSDGFGEVETRRLLVAKWMLAGRPFWKSVTELASALNVSTSTIYTDIKAMRDVWRIFMAHAYGEYAALILMRLDNIYRVAETALNNALAEDSISFDAIDAMLKVIDRQVKLLGLNASPGTLPEAAKNDANVFRNANDVNALIDRYLERNDGDVITIEFNESENDGVGTESGDS